MNMENVMCHTEGFLYIQQSVLKGHNNDGKISVQDGQSRLQREVWNKSRQDKNGLVCEMGLHFGGSFNGPTPAVLHRPPGKMSWAPAYAM